VMWAVGANNQDVVRILIQCGANVDLRDKDGSTALHVAGIIINALSINSCCEAANGYEECIVLLVKEGNARTGIG
jgi:hypothetical protein